MTDATEKLNADVKAKWLEALRGGQYKQAEGVLKDAQGCHCCLGVLADITDPSGWSPKLQSSDESGQDCYPYDTQDTMLQPKALKKFGLTTDTAVKLAGMNDDGCSFTEIAKWIETNL